MHYLLKIEYLGFVWTLYRKVCSGLGLLLYHLQFYFQTSVFADLLDLRNVGLNFPSRLAKQILSISKELTVLLRAGGWLRVQTDFFSVTQWIKTTAFLPESSTDRKSSHSVGLSLRKLEGSSGRTLSTCKACTQTSAIS